MAGAMSLLCCCHDGRDAQFELIRANLAKMDTEVKKTDESYRACAERMLFELDAKEAEAQAKLDGINREREELEEKVKLWKARRDGAEDEMLFATRTHRSCQANCSVM